MERNRRARAYSHACRIRRLRNALWAVAAVLTVLLEDAAAAGARRELVTWKTDLRQGETPS